MNSIICEPYRQMCLYMCVMVDQREALAVTTRLTDQVYFTTKLIGTWVKVKGWTSTCYPFPEAILVQATTSTTIQSAGRRVYRNSIICENKKEREV